MSRYQFLKAQIRWKSATILSTKKTHCDNTRGRLMTNNPEKIEALRARGIGTERVLLEIPPTASNLSYLQTKRERMGHLLTALSETKGGTRE